MYKAVLIDWDDTIGDWKNAALHSLQDLYEEFHLSEWFPSFEAWYTLYHAHNLELWDQYGRGEVTKIFLHRERFLWPLLQALELPFAPQPLVDLADRLGTRFLELTNHYFEVLPHAAEVVQALAKKYPLVVVSNGFKEVQYYKLAHSGLASYFSKVIISEEVGVNKPDPRIYLLAIESIDASLSPKDVVMIGDAYSSDIAGAKAAGIDQIWITSNPGDQTATYIVQEISEVLSIL